MAVSRTLLNAGVEAAGERIRLEGNDKSGAMDYNFDDQSRHGADGDKGCSHEYPGNANNDLKAHIGLMLSEFARFMKSPDLTTNSFLFLVGIGHRVRHRPFLRDPAQGRRFRSQTRNRHSPENQLIRTRR